MEKGKKYKFTGKKKEFEGHTLRQIKYIRKASDKTHWFVKGKIGGWIEHEGNLSHDGDCFINEDAMVFGNAQVTETALVGNWGIVKDNAVIKGDAMIIAGTVGADTIITDEVVVTSDSKIFFYETELTCSSKKTNEAHISGNGRIKNCVIEATGSIRNSVLIDRHLSGVIDLKNQQDDGENT